MRNSLRHTFHIARQYLTHGIVAGAILALTGAAPEHWLADLLRGVHLSPDVLHLWEVNVDLRIVLFALGFVFIVGDLIWMRAREGRAAEPVSATAAPAAVVPPLRILPLPDKPSIAVLPFANLSGDPAREYFSDGITEDIITELSRFHALFVIARNSTFTYKNKPVTIRQVARELGVRYVLEGSARKSGNRARVSAQLVDAIAGHHLWAEHFDRTLDDGFAVHEDVTRGIVSAVAPEVELAEMAQARHANPNDNALRLTWRAQGLMLEGVRTGRAGFVLDAIATARQAIAADSTSLAAYNVLAWANFSVHLYRWGPEPAQALDAITVAVEQMARLDALDHRTLTISGVLRVLRGEQDRGLADLRRAFEVNPNCSQSLMWLALCEAMAGLGEAAKAHAALSVRLNPRDSWIGVAHVARAMVSFCARDYSDAARLAELAIQSEPAVPLRRAIMIACCARLGDQARAAKELAVLNRFAPGFIASLARGEFQVFRRPDDMEHLRDSLRLAGVTEQPA